MTAIKPIDQVFWYLKKSEITPLRTDIKADVVVIGGGMAGLTAAQSFQEKGLSVVLLEKYFCGAGASGKSSGFITPDSEFSLSSMVDRYGAEEAKRLWNFVGSGVEHIRNNIESYSIDCDYQAQDSLILANTWKSFYTEIELEYKARLDLKYPATLYTSYHIADIIGSEKYYGALSYGGCFGIRSYSYCQGMKQILQTKGMQIYEETPVIKITGNSVETPYSKVTAENIVVCVDRFLPDLGALKYDVYSAQTFLLISSPLTEEQRRTIFPNRNLMAWDTDLIYNYFRVTGDNRLLIGGGSLLSMYNGKEEHGNIKMAKKLINYINQKFPNINIEFEYFWPGLIGVSKDIMPIAGRDKNRKNIYYIAGAGGLPWAAALGKYSAENMVNDNKELDHYFSPYRKFPIGPKIQRLIGTKATFALSHFLSIDSF